MKPADDQDLASIAAAISDGQPVSWGEVESGPRPPDPAVLRELRVIATLADLHRSPDGAGELGSSSTASAEFPQWGNFRLLGEIGKGSFGVVYRAWDPRLAREVALKLIPARGHSDGEHQATLREGRLLAKVRHPNIITVYGAEVIDGVIGIWMELLRGRTLQQELNDRGAFSATEAALAGIEVNRALAAVHKVDLVHRDVKAQNVMREEGGRIVLMDFGAGVDLLTVDQQSISLAGTPLYMAPELFTTREATPASDRYSLGVLLYHLVTNEFPVRAPTIGQLRSAHEHGTRRRLRDVRPDLPAAFIQAVEGATEPLPSNRTPSAAALEADLERVIRTAPEPAVSRPRRTVGWLVAMTVVLLIGLTASLIWKDAIFGPGPPPVSAEIRSLVVLPFANLSGQADQEYLADGVTDLLITHLGKLPSIRVISRSSAMNYKGRNVPLAQIARDLSIDAVVEGSISRSGDRIRISAQLLRPDESRVWGQSYERPTADLFRIQAEISGVIAEALKLPLTPTEREALANAPVIRAQAQDAFLRGLQRVNMTQDLELALTDLLLAVKLDPSSSRAHATLSQCYLLLGTRESLPRHEAYPRALAAATRALQLDDTVAEAHTELAEVKFYYEWDWETARVEYERALALNPNGSHAMARYSQYLSALGRHEEALRYAVSAQQLDPVSATIRFAPAMARFYAKQYPESVAAFNDLAKLPPFALAASDHVGLGRAYAEMKRYPEAVQAIERAIAMSKPLVPWRAELARIHAVAGRPAEARRILAELTTAAKPPAPANLAFVYAALGEHDEAFAALEQAVNMRSAALLWANVDPRLDVLRADPRFQKLKERIGLH